MYTLCWFIVHWTYIEPDGCLLENTASEHATFVVAFNAMCNSAHVSQSFQKVQGKTQDYCRLSENNYWLVKNTLIYNTVSTDRSAHLTRSIRHFDKKLESFSRFMRTACAVHSNGKRWEHFATVSTSRFYDNIAHAPTECTTEKNKKLTMDMYGPDSLSLARTHTSSHILRYCKLCQ